MKCFGGRYQLSMRQAPVPAPTAIRVYEVTGAGPRPQRLLAGRGSNRVLVRSGNGGMRAFTPRRAQQWEPSRCGERSNGSGSLPQWFGELASDDGI